MTSRTCDGPLKSDKAEKRVLNNLFYDSCLSWVKKIFFFFMSLRIIRLKKSNINLKTNSLSLFYTLSDISFETCSIMFFHFFYSKISFEACL